MDKKEVKTVVETTHATGVKPVKEITEVIEQLQEKKVELTEINKAAKEVSKEKQELEQELLDALKGTDGGSYVYNDYLYKRLETTTRKAFDVNAFKAQYPELYKEFYREKVSDKPALKAVKV